MYGSIKSLSRRARLEKHLLRSSQHPNEDIRFLERAGLVTNFPQWQVSQSKREKKKRTRDEGHNQGCDAKPLLSTHQKNTWWQDCLGMQGRNVTPHPDRLTWNHCHLAVVSPLSNVSMGRHGTTELTKQGYDLRAEASGVKKKRRKEQKKWWNYKLTSTLTTLFLRFVHSDAPERSGRGDTFSSAKTPLVIHIKTEGRAAEVETEKSHWCGTNSFGGFSFFLH